MMMPPIVRVAPIRYEETARAQPALTELRPSALAYELQADSSECPRVRAHTPTVVVISPNTRTLFRITSHA